MIPCDCERLLRRECGFGSCSWPSRDANKQDQVKLSKVTRVDHEHWRGMKVSDTKRGKASVSLAGDCYCLCGK